MEPNVSVVVDDERGGTIVGNVTARDWEGKPTEVVTWEGKTYVRTEDEKFEEKK